MRPEIVRMVSLYEEGKISRRALIAGLAALVLGVQALAEAGRVEQEPVVRARTLNHVSIITADVARSKIFYQRLAGLPVRAEAKDYCEFRLEGAFLGLYAAEAGEKHGFDHFCLGIGGYNAPQLLGKLRRALPEARPSLEEGDQVYVRDPDGTKVQFAGVNYKL